MFVFIIRIISVLLVGTVGTGAVLYVAKDTDFVKNNLPVVFELFNNTSVDSEKNTADKLKNNIKNSIDLEKKITEADLNKLNQKVKEAKEKLIKDYTQYTDLQNKVYKNVNSFFNCVKKNNINLSSEDLKTIKKVLPKKISLPEIKPEIKKEIPTDKPVDNLKDTLKLKNKKKEGVVEPAPKPSPTQYSF